MELHLYIYPYNIFLKIERELYLDSVSALPHYHSNEKDPSAPLQYVKYAFSASY
jgi:hypothetical protein